MLDDERMLIDNSCHGHAESFGLLYDRYAPQIYRFILLKVGNKTEAEDLAHDVFMSAWKNMPTYKPSAAPFTSWLYQIARNRVIDYYRLFKKHTAIDKDTDAAPHAALVSAHHQTLIETLDRNIQLAHIASALKNLNDDQQTVLIMRYIEELSPKEIALTLKKTEGAVRILQYRAIKNLKRIMNKTYGY